jgi:hypothetical protein
MRTLATLATLIVGLAFVYWAPTAKADCPHKGTNFDHKHCDGEEPPLPPGVTLGDLSCSGGNIARFNGTDWYCESRTPGPLVVRDDDWILDKLQYLTASTIAAENSAWTKPQRRAVHFRLRSVSPPPPRY